MPSTICHVLILRRHDGHLGVLGGAKPGRAAGKPSPATNYNFYTCHKTTLISFFRGEQHRKSIRDRDQSNEALQDQVTWPDNSTQRFSVQSWERYIRLKGPLLLLQLPDCTLGAIFISFLRRFFLFNSLSCAVLPKIVFFSSSDLRVLRKRSFYLFETEIPRKAEQRESVNLVSGRPGLLITSSTGLRWTALLLCCIIPVVAGRAGCVTPLYRPNRAQDETQSD